MGGNAGFIVGGFGLFLAVAQMAWSRFFSREGKARDALVGQLAERIASQETRQLATEARLDTERDLRRHAEDKVHALEMYVIRLEGELRRHGIDVPSSPVFEAAR